MRELPGGTCVSLMHLGPYSRLRTSYARILKYIADKGYGTIIPSREVYHKGPGMIFKGNPEKYLTEIQFFVDRSGGDGGPVAVPSITSSL